MSEPMVPIQEPVVDQKEYNFAQLRKIAEQERSARIALEERLAAIEKDKVQKPHEEEEDDEPYVDKKKLKKALSSFEADMEKKIDLRAEQRANSLIQQERDSLFLQANQDFSKIMESDLVQKFADAHPALAASILKMPDGFERQKLVYANIKALKIDQPEQKKPSIQNQVNANRTNPGFQPNGISGAPYETVADFSEQGMKNAYERTQALIRGMKR